MNRFWGAIGIVTAATAALDAAAQAPVAAGGAIYSSAQTTLQSFLRFTNTGPTAGSITVNVRNASTGGTLGQWVTAPIPVNGEFQFPLTTLEAGTSIGTRPDFYAISLQSSISGFFQHVLFRPADGTLTNLSTCASGIVAEPAILSGVHSSLLQIGYPSTIAVNNTGTVATTVTLSIYDARNGSLRGTYTTPSIPAGGQLQVSVPTIEATVGAPTANMLHYVVRVEEAFTGYLQHLVNNV